MARTTAHTTPCGRDCPVGRIHRRLHDGATGVCLEHDGIRVRVDWHTRERGAAAVPYPDPPAVAVAHGHTLAPDPPHALSSALRWTCTTCGDAVLDYRGNVYGRATERPCPGAVTSHA